MTPERWAKIKEIFTEVVELPTEQRPTALAARCGGDQELQAAVTDLLAQNDALEQIENADPPVIPTLLAAGDLLTYRYQIIRLLGSGGMGEVYEAEDNELGGRVALKVILPEILAHKAGLDRFRREVQLARQITHPNVCRIFDIEHHQDGDREFTFLTMELVRGESLSARLRRTGPLLLSETEPIAFQICWGLGAAHDAGILHRDLKPSNIMLHGTETQSRAIVTDFSIARALHRSTDGKALTTGLAILGTPEYMSPEQLSGQELTVASDIYSVGLVLYEMVTGIRPFSGTAWMGVLKRLTDDPHDPRKIVPTLDERWTTAILRCLDREPAQRFRSTQELLDLLQGRTQHSATTRQLPGVAGIQRSTGIPSVPADYWKQNSPFRSLQVFEPEDSWLFFGRNSEIKDLLGRLRRSPVLAIVGNSGCGKSSLVRAGLVATLRSGRLGQGTEAASWRIAVFRPSAAPFDYLAETLPGQLAPDLSLREQAEFIADCRNKLPAATDALRNAISALVNATTKKLGNTHILLVADQFEELFTLTTDLDLRNRYIDALLAASQTGGSVPVHLVLALRADFYSHCLEHPELSRRLEENLYNVPRMTQTQLRETIENRLALANVTAEPGLIDALLADIGAEPGDLALLEHALGQLWERCGGSGTTLTNQAYTEIGRLHGALGRHADAVFAEIGDEHRKHLVQRIFLELVHLGEGAQDTRRRVRKETLNSLATAEQIEPLLTRLTSSRLLAAGREGEETFIEVSHEALIREWASLREWILQNREQVRLTRRLAQDAQEWEGLKRDPGALLQGAQLVQGEEWLAAHPEASGSLLAFLQAGIEAREQARRKERESQEREFLREQDLRREAEKRAAVEGQLRIQQGRSAVRLRWLSGGLVILALVAVAAAWFARQQQVLAEVRATAAQSEQMLRTDHGRALDLAIRGWQRAKTEEGHLAVTEAFPQVLAILPDDDAIPHLEFSPDGRTIVTPSYTGAAKVWRASDGRLLLVLQGNNKVVRVAAFSPDGQFIVTGGDDHIARIWNSSNGRLLFTLQGHTAAIADAAFSPDNQRLVTVSSDHTARVWDTTRGRLLFLLQGHSQDLVQVAFAPQGDRIVTASTDKTARVWSALTGHLLAVLQHDGLVNQAAFSFDGRFIATVSDDHSARIWDGNGRMVVAFHHNGPVTYAEFSSDGRRLVTAGNDNTARIWNTSDGHMLTVLQHGGPIYRARFSSNDHFIVTASFDHKARVWNSANGDLLAILQHDGPIYDARFSPDGQHICTAGAEHSARIWNLFAGRLVKVLQGHTDDIWTAEFSPDGQRIVTASMDFTARVWNTTDGNILFNLQGHTGRVWAAAFSPDGRQIVTAGDDHTARVWNSMNGHLLFVLQGHMDKIWNAVFSLDGQRIVTASEDHTARVWDSSDGRLLSVLQGHTGRVSTAAFSPDGRRIVTASEDHTARVWDSSDGRVLSVLQGHTGSLISAGFSPDGRRIVTAGKDHTARVWNSADGHLLCALQGHTAQVVSAAFSPDGQHLVTAGGDHTARVWNSADGRLLAVLQHELAVEKASFSRDGAYIVTASQDQTARVWSSGDWRLIASLQGHAHMVRAACFSPDGRLILTAGRDQTARLWQIITLSDIEHILGSPH